MKQQYLGLNLSTQRTHKAVFLDEMNQVVPWTQSLALIAPHAPRAKTGRPPFALETMLRIHFVQQWFSLSNLAMEEALFETALYREFVGLSYVQRIPDRVSILRFYNLLEEHQLANQILATVNAMLTDKGLMLREGTVIDANLIAAPSSTKNTGGERDPKMHQPKKGNQWHFGMTAHIGVGADSELGHTVVGTAAKVNDVTQASALVHGAEADVFADASYRWVDADNPNVHIVHRGKAKRISKQDRSLLKRRQAIEPIIGHLKADHRMDLCHLEGEQCDRLHAVLCAAGYNIRWLLRMIIKKGVAFLHSVFLRLHQASSGWLPWLASVVAMLSGTAKSWLSTRQIRDFHRWQGDEVPLCT